jgi:hypothetical protein
MTYARIAFVTWMVLDALAIVSFPFCVLLAALTAHLFTRSIPWAIFKYSDAVAALGMARKAQTVD